MGQMSIVLQQLSRQMKSTQAEPNSVVAVMTPVNLLENSQYHRQFERIMKKLSQLHEQNPMDLSNFAGIEIPEKLKAPECERYADTSRLETYLQAYLVRRMIQSYQSNLTGHALRWYILRKISPLKTWRELIHVFHQEYNIDITPDITLPYEEPMIAEHEEPLVAEIGEKRVNEALHNKWAAEQHPVTGKFPTRKGKEPLYEIIDSEPVQERGTIG